MVDIRLRSALHHALPQPLGAHWSLKDRVQPFSKTFWILYQARILSRRLLMGPFRWWRQSWLDGHVRSNMDQVFLWHWPQWNWPMHDDRKNNWYATATIKCILPDDWLIYLCTIQFYATSQSGKANDADMSGSKERTQWRIINFRFNFALFYCNSYCNSHSYPTSTTMGVNSVQKASHFPIANQYTSHCPSWTSRLGDRLNFRLIRQCSEKHKNFAENG